MCMYKAHSLIDRAASQCTRSFCYVVVCEVILKETSGRADGAGRVGEAGQGSPIKNFKNNIIKKRKENITAYQKTSQTGGHQTSN